MPSINIFTICLGGTYLDKVADSIRLSRELASHLPNSPQIRWVLCEGVAKPVKDTAWCSEAPSWAWTRKDGYIVSSDLGLWERVSRALGEEPIVIRSPQPYEGKVDMCNACLEKLVELGMAPGDTLMQMDGDEVWSPGDILAVHELWSKFPRHDTAMFYCNYYVGKGKMLLRGPDSFFGNRKSYEWRRAWLWKDKGMRFLRHEPPELEGAHTQIDQDKTFELGLSFRHYAYADEETIRFKSEYYSRPNLLEEWKSFQELEPPFCLLPYFPLVREPVWVVDDAFPEQGHDKPIHLLFGHGLGDAFMMYGAVAHLSESFPCVIYTAKPYYKDVKTLFYNKNVVVRRSQTIEESLDYALKSAPKCCVSQVSPLLCNSDEDRKLLEEVGSFDRFQYAKLKVPFYLKYFSKASHYDSPEFKELVVDVPKEKFVLLHDRPESNWAIKDELVLSMNPGCRLMRISPEKSIFYWLKLSQHAEAVHAIDSSFLNAVALPDFNRSKVPVYWHTYARKSSYVPHYPFWVNRVHG